ncbi:hypothetical protein FNL55_09550 [Tardiphaga sp. vice352]|uniref:DoxX family protein n=1 Tax=unclassified Tardiphaga TaxID=2631404 RepID=UPI00116303A3|nr:MULTISPECIES: DoxX family protein [unclassified Tardiphaga]QDM16244.1 hypothetical protein FNL53_10225 [Tardiphaga sp. vice278]QDM21268.1 hypothetical protein FIU28_09140 [Tardiphaga sp. vice154]QDM26453.1 hypothetical protein FNL56_10385 [Tardiphaga sp. vice304]QDM31519.1 hypothetical protein FNL55_09550 [Tardiphaga sp. vice352]
MNTADKTSASRGPSRAALRWVLAAFYVAAGVAHLWVPDKLLLIMPSWVPIPTAVILLTGVFELAAAAALVTRPLRRWAGVALALYALCVWPANFTHALEGIEMPVIGNSWWYHGPRLAFQPVLIWWALYCAHVIDWPCSRTRRADAR